MVESRLADVLIVAASHQRGRNDRLTHLLVDRGFTVEHWPPDVEDESADALTFAAAVERVALVVVLADEAFVTGRVGERAEITDVLTKIADRLAIVIVDGPGRSSLSLRAVDVYPTRGTLLDLKEPERSRALDLVATEIASELDRSVKPQVASLFEEYQLLFDSTDRLVQRRRETTQVFFAVNAALSAVIAFLIKDLSLPRQRLWLVTVPLFLMGMIASQLWRRTIEQYAALIDWRYRQIRRMERRGFTGSYKLFTREWEAIYAPKVPGTFGFSGLESSVPGVFMVLHLLGMAFVIAMSRGWLDRLGL